MRVTSLIVTVLAAVALLAGCAEKKIIPLSCGENAQGLIGEPGTSFKVSCPAKCGEGSLYGTDLYTDDSAVCKAGMHAGSIDSSGGEFTITIKPGTDKYKGSEKNGITSADWTTAWNRSFVID